MFPDIPLIGRCAKQPIGQPTICMTQLYMGQKVMLTLNLVVHGRPHYHHFVA
jgi:hypothetical protein